MLFIATLYSIYFSDSLDSQLGDMKTLIDTPISFLPAHAKAQISQSLFSSAPRVEPISRNMTEKTYQASDKELKELLNVNM